MKMLYVHEDGSKEIAILCHNGEVLYQMVDQNSPYAVVDFSSLEVALKYHTSHGWKEIPSKTEVRS